MRLAMASGMMPSKPLPIEMNTLRWLGPPDGLMSTTMPLLWLACPTPHVLPIWVAYDSGSRPNRSSVTITTIWLEVVRANCTNWASMFSSSACVSMGVEA